MSDRRIPFTPEDEDRIASASLWGMIAAITGILTSVVDTGLAAVRQLPARNMIAQVVSLLVSLLLGAWLIQACLAFRAVARTDVADKAYLLRGFDKLHHYFLTLGILLIIGVVLMVLALLIYFTVGADRVFGRM